MIDNERRTKNSLQIRSDGETDTRSEVLGSATADTQATGPVE
ncbi:hypothetical protein PROFUN_07856 [Planoprotostelium fungivorum]|uniref:Uncharacterized protein n=1 Tax=Planoprotostelium fungivorum TaxID=1890364 RepID=A0A2P6NLB7_9EUKA|nr:hypothetical protein PROFUN_07856 [Planoprotostelium fungivorum]